MNPSHFFRLILLFALALFQNGALAQKREMYVAEFLRLISKPGADTLTLENIKIIRGEDVDFHFLPQAMASVMPPQIMQNRDTLHVYRLLDLKNVELDWSFTFRQIRFHQSVWLENCDNNGILFKNCRLDSALFISSQSATSQVDMRITSLYGSMDLRSVRAFRAYGSSFFDRNSFEGRFNLIEFKSCQLEILRPGPPGFGQPSSLYLRGIDPAEKVSFEAFACNFKGTGRENGLDFFYVGFTYFNLQQCHFEVPVYFYLSSFDRVIIEQCTFDLPIDLRETSFPIANTNILFDQITQKIGVLDTFISTYEPGEKLYQASTDEELQNVSNYNVLMAVYAKLLATYRYRGDQKSYNSCYIEMKDIASRKARFDYQQHPSLESFFEWRLAQFLKTFCDYGTSPVKSLLFSFYVILAFAGMYFMFPSETDNLSKGRMHRFLLQALAYFRTEKQLPEFQTQKRQKAIKELEELRQKLSEAQKETPAVILWIGRPFYAWMQAYHGFLQWLYRRTDLVPGRWADLSPQRKTGMGILLGFYVAGYLLFGLFIRILNALALSLNVFVTLGYGEISASGAMRYLAVLEGLLGWFLLSIFSVSLIGQVLQ